MLRTYLPDGIKTAKKRAGPPDSAFNPQKLRDIRLASGLTQKGLAFRLGFPQSTSVISKIEHGIYTIEDSTGEITANYVEWLVERGYNPLGI